VCPLINLPVLTDITKPCSEQMFLLSYSASQTKRISIWKGDIIGRQGWYKQKGDMRRWRMRLIGINSTHMKLPKNKFNVQPRERTKTIKKLNFNNRKRKQFPTTGGQIVYNTIKDFPLAWIWAFMYMLHSYFDFIIPQNFNI